MANSSNPQEGYANLKNRYSVSNTANKVVKMANSIIGQIAESRKSKQKGDGSMFGSTKLEDGAPSLREQQEANMRSIRKGDETESHYIESKWKDIDARLTKGGKLTEDDIKFIKDAGLDPNAVTKPYGNVGSSKPKGKVARPKVIDIDAIVSDRAPYLADNTPKPGATNEALDNKIAGMQVSIPDEEETQESIAHRILNGIKKRVTGNKPTAEGELASQSELKDYSQQSGNAVDNTPIAESHALADNDANADYSHMDEGLKDLFSRFNGGTGATKEQMEQVLRYMNSEQSLNKG